MCLRFEQGSPTEAFLANEIAARTSRTEVDPGFATAFCSFASLATAKLRQAAWESAGTPHRKLWEAGNRFPLPCSAVLSGRSYSAERGVAAIGSVRLRFSLQRSAEDTEPNACARHFLPHARQNLPFFVLPCGGHGPSQTPPFAAYTCPDSGAHSLFNDLAPQTAATTSSPSFADP